MSRPHPIRRFAARVLTLSMTSAVLLVAVGTGAVTHGALASRAALSDAPAPAPALPVEIATLALQDSHIVPRRFAGQFEAPQQTALGFEEGGAILDITVREGDRVAAGDVLARLDTRLLVAERARLVAARDALDAQAELARRTNDRQSELRERGFATDQRVDDTSLALMQLRARIAEADAAIAALDVRLSKAELRAPYPGQIGMRMLNAGAVVSPGTAALTLVEDGPARFRVGVAPQLANALTLGETATIKTETGRLTAVLAQIAPELDPATRSRTLFFDVGGAAPPALSTGEITLMRQVAGRGAWVPLSALRQGPRGTWQIVTVADGADGLVAGTEAVEVLRLDADRAFIRGTFSDGMRYLPDGIHRVVPGERLAAIEGA